MPVKADLARCVLAHYMSLCTVYNAYKKTQLCSWFCNNLRVCSDLQECINGSFWQQPHPCDIYCVCYPIMRPGAVTGHLVWLVIFTQWWNCLTTHFSESFLSLRDTWVHCTGILISGLVPQPLWDPASLHHGFFQDLGTMRLWERDKYTDN